MTIDLGRIGLFLTVLSEEGQLEHAWQFAADGTGFHADLGIGSFHVSYVPDDQTDQVGVAWTQLVAGEHQLGAAASVVAVEERDDTLLGRLSLVDPTAVLDPEDCAGVAPEDRMLQYVAVVSLVGAGFDVADRVRPVAETLAALPEEADLGDDERALMTILVRDAERLEQVVERFWQFVRLREDGEESLAAHELDWPAAVEALVDDTTSTAMLGVLFGRFEESSIHEHVFFHPAADRTLRERVVASWDRIASPDRPQPYGDPAAPSSAFTADRAASVAYLLSGAA
ncbi:hypothetical protein L615_000700000380 [Nocardioides sp. J9]|uniref:hypothetical protein n=1 Tax=unclassified Nocardioides TaxID=2615069 RepID=UPI00048A4ACB|nr:MULTISPECIES: hypothetical protein [unclassified Nocardioides]TWG92631.1 hypothetical protein L615_000700000380 [Nocardioides sp. J9]